MHASSLHASLNQTEFNANIDYLRCDPLFFELLEKDCT